MSITQRPSARLRLVLTAQSEAFAGAMKSARRPTGLVLGTIVAVILILSIQAAVLVLQLALPWEWLAEGGLVLACVGFLAVWALLWLWMRFKEKRAFRTIGFTHARRAPFLLMRGAVVAMVAMAVIVGIGVATGDLRFLSYGDGTIVDWSALGWVLVAIPAFAVQGGAEELINRGYLLQVWYRRVGLVGAIAAQAVFFTVMHGANTGFSIVPALSLISVSLLLAFWALAEGSLWGPLAFHGIWNWSQGVFFGIAVSGNPVPHSLFLVGATDKANPVISGGDFGIEGSVITVVVLLAAAAVAAVAFIRQNRARRVTPTGVLDQRSDSSSPKASQW